MKQKTTILAMVVMATILIASPVLAAGPSRTVEVAIGTPTILSMTATIDAVDFSSRTNSGTIEVTIRMTNRAFIQYRGESAEVVIDDDTVCLEWTSQRKARPKPMDCSELDSPDKISVIARVDPVSKEISARRVLLYHRRIR